jgi:hypothetical protein
MKKCLYFLIIAALTAIYNTSAAHSPTWTDGIACIIYSHCTNCHNDNGIAPFSLMTYNDVYQNRFAIQASVAAKSMPPFPPKQDKQQYAHANTLDQHEIDEITDWVNNFAPLGNANQIPTPPVYTAGAQLSNPDKVLQIPTYTVNTTTDLYRCFVLPLNNANQEFIQQIEVIPGNRDIVHHALVFQDTSSIPINLDAADPIPGYTAFGSTGSATSKLVLGYTPGQGLFNYAQGFGARIAPNSYIVIQIHYPGGVSNKVDSTKVLLKYGPSMLRNLSSAAILNHNSTLVNGPLTIPANTVKTFNNQFFVANNTVVTGVLPHMHLIGKSIKAISVSPSSDTTVLVDIPEWDFHWQGFYQFQKPLLIPAGSTLYGEATYDNTSNNPNNPNNPPLTVVKGEGTSDEMFLIYFNFAPYIAGDTNIIVDTSSHFVHAVSCQTPTSIQPSFKHNSIELFPNPANDKLYISGLDNQSEVQLFSVNGKVISSTTLQPNMPLQISDLTTGVYYIQIQLSNGQMLYRKFVKN